MRALTGTVLGLGGLLLVSLSTFATADHFSAELHVATADGNGASVGTVRFEDSEFGLLITPNLHGLQPGPHAAHVHQNPDCGVSANGTMAGAAGDHFDPEGTGVHGGPYGEGHAGDLPNLIVESDGNSIIPVLAPRLQAADVEGHALMIHAGADRYNAYAKHEDGKGGARMYCGAIR